MVLKLIMGLKPREARETFRITGSAKLRKMIKKEAKKKIGDQGVLDRLKALMDRSEDATEKRNETVHRFWCTRDGKKIIVDMDKKGGSRRCAEQRGQSALWLPGRCRANSGRRRAMLMRNPAAVLALGMLTMVAGPALGAWKSSECTTYSNRSIPS